MIPKQKRVISPQGFWLNPMSPRRAEGEALAAGLPAVIGLLCRYICIIYVYTLRIYICVYYSVTELSERAMERERKREREMYDVCIIYIYLCVQYIYIYHAGSISVYVCVYVLFNHLF